MPLRAKHFECSAYTNSATERYVAGPPGIEPRSQDLESRILPLNYSPIVEEASLELATFGFRDRRSNQLSYSSKQFINSFLDALLCDLPLNTFENKGISLNKRVTKDKLYFL